MKKSLLVLSLLLAFDSKAQNTVDTSQILLQDILQSGNSGVIIWNNYLQNDTVSYCDTSNVNNVVGIHFDGTFEMFEAKKVVNCYTRISTKHGFDLETKVIKSKWIVIGADQRVLDRIQGLFSFQTTKNETIIIPCVIHQSVKYKPHNKSFHG